MNTIKKILKAIVCMLLIYVLGIVAIPAMIVVGASIGIFGNTVIYVLGAVATVWIIVHFIGRR